MDNYARFLRLPEVIHITGLGRSTIYDYMDRDEFPQAVQLGSNRRAWVEHEVQEWIAARMAERNSA